MHLALALALAFATHPAGSRPPARAEGRLVVVGGGGTPQVVLAAALELAGGSAARVTVLPQASRRSDAGAGAARMWREAGARHVEVLDLDDPEEARARLARADLVWMSGGSQGRLVKALRTAGVHDALRRRLEEGAVVGGTSAGAAALSRVMIAGPGRATFGPEAVAIERGLGLWPDVIVDQHFVRRARHGRLLAAVHGHPTLVGVGIDERTACIVEGRRLRVLGEGTVTLVDARKAVVLPAGGGRPPAMTGVRLHVLVDGMSRDL